MNKENMNTTANKMTEEEIQAELVFRKASANRIADNYEAAVEAVAKLGRSLRIEPAAQYMWGAEHKTAVSGIKAILALLGQAVRIKY
jgi:hypothetical protein